MLTRGATLVSLLEGWAEAAPDRPFFVFQDGRLGTIGEFNSDVNRLAHGLAELAVGRGDHVAVMLDSDPEAPSLTFALRKLGAIEVCIAPQVDLAALTRLLRSTRPKLLVLRGGSLARLVDLPVGVLPPVLVTVGDDSEAGELPGGSTRIALDRVPGERQDDPPRRFDDTQPEAILVEHGFDGSLRRCVLSHRSGATIALALVRALGIRDNDCLYNALPTAPIESRYLTLGAALWAGCRVVVGPRFSTESFWEECRGAGVTVFSFNAAILTALWAQPAAPAEADNAVRLAWGAPIPTFGPLFEERFGVRLAPGYGVPAAGIVTWRDPAARGEPYGSSGRVVPPYEIRIADEHGDPVPDGGVGEILVRSSDSNVVASECLNLSERNSSMLRGMWLHTGDYGRLDADGRLFVAGRRNGAARNTGEHLVLSERIGLGGPFGPPST